MMEKLKQFAIEQVLWAEKNLNDKTGAEKKDAVIKKIDDFLPISSGPMTSSLLGSLIRSARS